MATATVVSFCCDFVVCYKHIIYYAVLYLCGICMCGSILAFHTEEAEIAKIHFLDPRNIYFTVAADGVVLAGA